MAGVKINIPPIHIGNLESFSIFWFDSQVYKTDDYRKAQQKLRQVINHVEAFDNQAQYQQYILSWPPQERLILVINGQCDQQLFHQVHHLNQISSIHVQSTDKKTNQQWTQNFPKVKSTVRKLDDLITEVKQDHKNQMKIEEPLAINFFSTGDNSEQSTTGLNGNFIHSLLLIDVLMRTESLQADKKQLVSVCKQEYSNNDEQLAILREFEDEYSEDKALWWYTRETFLYKILNKALRVQNIDLLFLLRFVIGDIYRQLKQNQYQTPVQVYRGQRMSDKELDALRRSINNFISINSFFSTSLDRSIALNFLRNIRAADESNRVLFEIDADPRVVTTKPFVDLSSFSAISGEREILFMIGSVFRLVEIREDNDQQISIIKMKLCSDDQHQMKKLYDHMKKQYGGGDNEVNLRSFGDVLRQMGKYNLAEKMYHRLLNELPENHPSLDQLYFSLGMVTKDKGGYDTSLVWYESSLKMKMQKDPSNHVWICSAYNWIGVVYRLKGDYKTALEYYNKAVALFEKANDENHPDMGHLYNNIAIIYRHWKKYWEALDYHKKAFDIQGKYLPSDHPDVASSYNNLGSVHLELGQFDLAMQHYDQALKIRLKSLPSQHPDIAMSYQSIGVVYENMKDWKQAFIYYEKAANTYRQSLSAQHPYVIQIEESIQRVSSK